MGRLTWKDIVLLALAGVCAFLLFKEISAPDVIDYGPDIKALQEKQLIYDQAISDFNKYSSERVELKNERELRHEKIDHVRSTNSDSLRRAHLRDLLNRSE